MGERQQQQQHATISSRFGMRTAVGEIVEVQGGHIVRSTGRKDRHSKVCTAKGPRDRRVRLSAHTAMQFYDVQDRLGFDRPSKAVDWLIKKAKTSIEELAELPAWNPTAETATNTSKASPISTQEDHITNNLATAAASGGYSRRTAATVAGSDVHHVQHQIAENHHSNSTSSFLPPSLDSDVIADTIKSFFPMGATAETPSASMPFPSYPPDLLSRTSSQNQDLRLSLQSFQEQQPMLLHHQAHQNEHHVLFSGATPQYFGFDGSAAGWSEQHHPVEMGRFKRTVAWNAAADTGSDGGRSGGGGEVGFIFNTPSQPPSSLLQPLFGQNQFISQRGPLQSSNTPSVRAWIDPGMIAEHQQQQHHHHHHQIQQIHHHHQSAISGLGFASSSGGFSGFRIPARIHGEEEEHDGIQHKPSSASSDSRH